jgi:hypothetical protein
MVSVSSQRMSTSKQRAALIAQEFRDEPSRSPRHGRLEALRVAHPLTEGLTQVPAPLAVGRERRSSRMGASGRATSPRVS